MTDDSTEPTDGRSAAGTGFSTTEKAIGAWAAYEHPLISSAVAGRMLESETDPTRRSQLTTFRRATMLWWVAGLVAALIGAIVVISIASGHGLTGGACRGGPDKFDAMNITYQSNDGNHWTATYPCVNGGSTTIPVPRRKVPGGGR
jgi:hypothetical protein